LGVGFGGLGIGPNPQTPNPQSPIPNPQSPNLILNFLKKIKIIKNKNKLLVWETK
jgi:hypothetical protein